jgi:glycosyltransferase involved in cell wall biosynthesis
MDVRDLWPEAAVVLGELRGARAIRAAEWLEQRLYDSATGIITVTEPFREVIATKADPAKIEVIPNGTTQAWIDAGRAPIDRAAADFPDDRFVWVYGGNFGIAQGLEHAVEAAGLLGPEFKLVLLGGGPERERLGELAAALPPGLVEFREPVQPLVAAKILRAADALLVSLGAAPELAKFVPSKLFDCCALGRPVIVAAAGEAARLAGDQDAAAIVPPGDPAALAAAVRRLRDDPDHASALAAAGPPFAEQFRRERQVERVEAVLERAVAISR